MTLFLVPFLFLTSTALALPADPAVVKAIVDDLDNLVGDTVDEGSWDANVIRDQSGNPTKTQCKASPSQQGDIYTCNITFLVTPYEGEDIDSDPWEATCDSVRYKLKSRRGEKPIIVGRFNDSLDRCLETLSEGP